MGQAVADISKDHSAIILSSSVPNITLNTKAIQSFTTPGTTQHHNHKKQHKCAKLKLIAVVKLRGTLQEDMKIEDVRNTTVVAFILFQHSAYGQVKMIQSQGVWESSIMN